jgi:predicted transcriptional regulator of viral defense system
MYTLLKSHLVQIELERRGVGIFTPYEFQTIFHLKPDQAKYYLESFVKQKLFIRLKRGLYMLVNAMISEEEVANRLYQPSYLSLEYVLHRAGELSELPYEITSVTMKPTRKFEVNGKIFAYTTIKKSEYGGYTVKMVNNRPILTATAEQAKRQYDYLRSLGRRGAYVGNR